MSSEDTTRDVGTNPGVGTNGDGDGLPRQVGDTGDGSIPRSARWLVAILLIVLLVPGLVGLELWPVTGWKLFSLSRGSTQASWVLEGVEVDGSTRLVDLEELPMAYSNAEWQLRSVGRGSFERREELCTALFEAVVEVDPQIVELRIARDEQELVRDDGSWTVSHDMDVRHTCGPGAQ